MYIILAMKKKNSHDFGLSFVEPRHQTCEVFACGHYRHWPDETLDIYR